jgi:hypothetical protein
MLNSCSDYIYVLRECLDKSDAPYIAIFEDDIIFAEAWLAKTINALAELRQRSQSWLYLRLFYTETSLSWRASDDFWYGHQLLTFSLTMTAVLLLLLLGKLTSGHSNVINPRPDRDASIHFTAVHDRQIQSAPSERRRTHGQIWLLHASSRVPSLSGPELDKLSARAPIRPDRLSDRRICRCAGLREIHAGTSGCTAYRADLEPQQLGSQYSEYMGFLV